MIDPGPRNPPARSSSFASRAHPSRVCSKPRLGPRHTGFSRPSPLLFRLAPVGAQNPLLPAALDPVIGPGPLRERQMRMGVLPTKTAPPAAITFCFYTGGQ